MRGQLHVFQESEKGHQTGLRPYDGCLHDILVNGTSMLGKAVMKSGKYMAAAPVLLEQKPVT